tara:strand:+ start:3365 stop:4024 length:660 start_codon:yes stop_codon:yes gene_type:complete
MIVKTTQDTIKINVDADKSKIGIKLSGGLDSAIVAYLLCKYIHEERPDCTLIPFTVIHSFKPYNLWFASKVKWWLKEHFPTVQWHKEHFTIHSNGDDYNERMEELQEDLKSKNIIDCKFSGVTANPPMEVYKQWSPNDTNDEPTPGRDREQELKDTSFGRVLVNIDKKGVAELYKKFGLMDSLFNVTRTCEETELDPSVTPHCGKCWWCEERRWGFGKL